MAESRGHWAVNQEPKMADMLLRSCQKGMNENNMSVNQKVKFESKWGTGQIVNFSIFWV